METSIEACWNKFVKMVRPPLGDNPSANATEAARRLIRYGFYAGMHACIHMMDAIATLPDYMQEEAMAKIQSERDQWRDEVMASNFRT